MPLPMRLAPITGVYGLSFRIRDAGLRRSAASSSAALGANFSGWQRSWRCSRSPAAHAPQPASRKALLVQPNIDTEMQWTEDNLRDLEQRMARLSRTSGADMILWPEVPAPFYLNEAPFRDYTAQIAQAAQTPLLFGAVGFTPQKEPLNSAEMLDSSGKAIDRYDKINLVPFGEFIPPLFGWVNRITKEIGDFVPGERVVTFPVDEHKLGAFICYESAFPDLVRQFTHSGAEVLVNLSNDGYFGHSAAHEQHLKSCACARPKTAAGFCAPPTTASRALIDPRGRVRRTHAAFTQTAAHAALTTYVTRADALHALRRLVRVDLLARCGFGLMSAVSLARRRP